MLFKTSSVRGQPCRPCWCQLGLLVAESFTESWGNGHLFFFKELFLAA